MGTGDPSDMRIFCRFEEFVTMILVILAIDANRLRKIRFFFGGGGLFSC